MSMLSLIPKAYYLLSYMPSDDDRIYNSSAESQHAPSMAANKTCNIRCSRVVLL